MFIQVCFCRKCSYAMKRQFVDVFGNILCHIEPTCQRMDIFERANVNFDISPHTLEKTFYTNIELVDTVFYSEL